MPSYKDDEDEYQPRSRSRSRPRRKLPSRTVKPLTKAEKEIALLLVGLSRQKIYLYSTERKRKAVDVPVAPAKPTKVRRKTKAEEQPIEPQQSYPPVPAVPPVQTPSTELFTPPLLMSNPMINVNPWSPQCTFPRSARHVCLAFYIYRKLRNEAAVPTLQSHSYSHPGLRPLPSVSNFGSMPYRNPPFAPPSNPPTATYPSMQYGLPFGKPRF
ncbi:hypothetical protein RCL1_004082 [Eukaryota sp. TZLM3-RCL]